MVLFPLSTFYVFQFVLFKGNKDMLIWSGFAAVFAVNIVIYSYVWMAWHEDKPNNSKEHTTTALSASDSAPTKSKKSD